jgi:hypothetical protein
MSDLDDAADARSTFSNGRQVTATDDAARGFGAARGQGAPEVFFGRAFPLVDTVEVCFRRDDQAATLQAAAEWLHERPGWFVRALWYEHQGAHEISEYDHGPRGALWLIAEHGSDERAPAARRGL